mmetsp:Transcript_40030/g.132455  ORF Transcript_40030/g.132455 Transcript_40030/m.132455 type:complete len:252 (+) Transcript_40030:205-960(+)
MQHAAAVPHHHAVPLGERVAHRAAVGDAHEQKVGVRGRDPPHGAGELWGGERCGDAISLGEDAVPLRPHGGGRPDGAQSRLLCQRGQVERRLDAVEGGDERLGRNGDAHPRARQPPRLGEGLRDDEVRRAADERDARRGGLVGRKVDVGLVDDDERPCGGRRDGLDVGAPEKPPCRVARRAQEDELHPRRERLQNRANSQLVVVGGERDVDRGDVVDARKDLVHCVCRRADQDRVAAGLARHPDQEVDDLV